MDNAQKAIMIGVGLFITIIIIAAVMLITGMGQNLLNKGQSQVSGISESLMNDLNQQYDEKRLSGSQVRTAAIQLLNRDAGITVEISGTKTADGNDFSQNSGGSGDYTEAVNKALKGKDSVIYNSSVERDANKGTIKISFK